LIERVFNCNKQLEISPYDASELEICGVEAVQQELILIVVELLSNEPT